MTDTKETVALLQDILNKMDVIEREHKVLAQWVTEINLRQKQHIEASIESNGMISECVEMLTQCMEDDDE